MSVGEGHPIRVAVKLWKDTRDISGIVDEHAVLRKARTYIRNAVRVIQTIPEFIHPQIAHPRYAHVFPHCGFTLFDVIHKCDTYSIEHLRKVALQLLHTLKDLETNEIVHNHLAVENILIDPLNWEVTVIGWRLARMAGSTRDPAQKVTPYTSPEYLLGCDTNQPSADMWAFGCLLVEMATKNKAFPYVLDLMAFHVSEMDLPPTTMMDTPYGAKYFSKIDGSFRCRNNLYWTSPMLRKDACDHLLKLQGSSVDAADYFDLLSNIFVWHADKRITVDAAMKHPFFKARDSTAAAVKK